MRASNPLYLIVTERASGEVVKLYGVPSRAMAVLLEQLKLSLLDYRKYDAFTVRAEELENYTIQEGAYWYES